MIIYDLRIPSSQRSPYVAPLGYKRALIDETRINGYSFLLQSLWGRGGMYPGSVVTQRDPSGINYVNAHNKALNKLNDELGIAQGFFETWYERKAAISLIESSTKKLIFFAKNYKNPRKMAKLFKKKLKGVKPKSLPEAWIGYHFGVMPLVSDIDLAVNILNRQFPACVVTGSSSYIDVQKRSVVRSSATDWAVYTYTGIIKLGTTVYGANPNMDLAARLGLDKPLTSAYAVIPFSWAIDYFFNVGEMLSNMECRFPSLLTRYNFKTDLIKCSAISWKVYANKHPNWGKHESWGSQNGVFMHRTLPKTFTYKFTRNLSPLNPQRSSYLLSVAALIMSGKKGK